MKTLLLTISLMALAAPAPAAVVHDEGADGPLSSDVNAPTSVAFAIGSNTIIGSVMGSSDTRNIITFNIPAEHVLSQLNLVSYSPANIGFASFNTGTTSFVPGDGTAASFLSGINVNGSQVGTDLMNAFVNSSITGNSLSTAELEPGDYCFLIQQTNSHLTEFELEFVVEKPVQIEASTWGRVKSLFR